MRELVLAMTELESQLQQLYGVSLNEAMLLCCIGEETLTASVISEHTGLAPSNTSKVLRSIEKKGVDKPFAGRGRQASDVFLPIRQRYGNTDAH